MAGGKQPDWNLSVLDTRNDHRGNVGAIWLWADGTLSIQINPAVALTGEPHFMIKGFPKDWKPTKKVVAMAAQPQARPVGPDTLRDYDGDDIPF